MATGPHCTERLSEEVPFNLLNSDWLPNLSQTQSYSCDVIREGLHSVRVTNGYRRASCACALLTMLERRVRTGVIGCCLCCLRSKKLIAALPLLSGSVTKVSVVCPSRDLKGGVDYMQQMLVEELLVRGKLFLFIVTPTRLNMLKMVCANY